MAHDLVLHGARLLTGTEPHPAGVVETDGWVAVVDGRVAALGHGVPPEAAERVDVAGDWLTPGYVDVHVHGGAGAAFFSVYVAATTCRETTRLIARCR